MRRHGWAGDPPRDEDEARRRILEAAMRCVDRQGPLEASLSDVAAEVGVTRQTVYRYYPSTEELFSALAQLSADEFIGRIVEHMARFDDPATATVEGLAYTIEAIPNETYLGLLLRTGDAFSRGIVSEVAMDFGRSLLRRSHIDWGGLGYADAEVDEFVELQLRLIQSLTQTPASPSGRSRTPAELRGFLQRWIAPAVNSRVPAA